MLRRVAGPPGRATASASDPGPGRCQWHSGWPGPGSAGPGHRDSRGGDSGSASLRQAQCDSARVRENFKLPGAPGGAATWQCHDAMLAMMVHNLNLNLNLTRNRDPACRARAPGRARLPSHGPIAAAAAAAGAPGPVTLSRLSRCQWRRPRRITGMMPCQWPDSPGCPAPRRPGWRALAVH